jgi:hypothetical protein
LSKTNIQINIKKVSEDVEGKEFLYIIGGK